MELNTETRTKNAEKNIITAIMNKILILFLTLISRKVFIHFIGIEYLGINSLFSNVLTLLCMADMGLGTAMNVTLYKPIAENDTKKLAALLNYYKKLYYYIAIMIAVAGTGLLPFLPYFVNMDIGIPYLSWYYLIFLANTVISYLFVYKSAIINADQKSYIVNKIGIYVNVGKVILQILAVAVFKKYLFYILLDVAATLINNLVISFMADRNYPFIKEKELLKQKEKRNLFENISSIFIYKIAWALLNGTDNILISVLTGTIMVGIYSNYLAVINSLESFIAILFSSLTAGIGNLVATSDFKRQYKTFQCMQMVSFWIGSIVVICLYFLLQDFILIWLGAEYVLDDISVIAIIVNVFFSSCMRPVWTFREGTGMYQQIRYIMLITAIENMILSIVLGHWFGLSGILFATSISKFTTYFWYEPRILFQKFFHKKVSSYYFAHLKNIVLLFLCGVVCYIPIQFIQKVSINYWILKAVICLIIINLIYLFFYYKSEEFENIKEKINSIKK